MTLLKLKKLLHEKNDGSNDPQILEQVAAILSNQEKVFIIPEHMKEAIRQGQDDIKNGLVHTMEDFEKKYEKWLKNNYTDRV